MLVSTLHKPTMRTLAFARAIRPDALREVGAGGDVLVETAGSGHERRQ